MGPALGIAIYRFSDETPLLARYHVARAVAAVARCHHVIGVIRVRCQISLMIAMSQRQRGFVFIQHPIGAHQAANRLHALLGNRHQKTQRFGCRRHVPLPADPHQRVALAHQQAVAKILLLLGAVGVNARIEIGQQRFAAAITHLQDAQSTRLSRVFGLQHHEIRRGFDVMIHVERRKIEIDNFFIRDAFGIKRKRHQAFDFFVGARSAERLALQYIRARFDFDGNDRGGAGPRRE